MDNQNVPANANALLRDIAGLTTLDNAEEAIAKIQELLFKASKGTSPLSARLELYEQNTVPRKRTPLERELLDIAKGFQAQLEAMPQLLAAAYMGADALIEAGKFLAVGHGTDQLCAEALSKLQTAIAAAQEHNA